MKQIYDVSKRLLSTLRIGGLLLLCWSLAQPSLYSQCPAPPCIANNDAPINFSGYQCGMTGIYGPYYNSTGEAIAGTPDGCTGAVTVGTGGSYAVNGSLEIQAGGSLTVESGGVAHIFGNMYNMGTIDVQSGGTLYFYGDQWINGSAAAVTGAGTIHFYNPRPAPDGMTTIGGFTRPVDGANGFAAAASTQCFDAGGITMQPNFVFTNPNDINFTGLTYTFNWATNPPSIAAGADNAGFSGQATFGIDGTRLWLNNNTMTMTSSGTFSGCGPDRFVVTNGTGTLTKTGLSAGAFLFPVGPCDDDYAPAQITDGTLGADDYAVRVQNSLSTPSTVPDVTAPTEGPGRYWNVTSPASMFMTLDLLHDKDANEGAAYAANDNIAYITRNVGAPSGSGATESLVNWDRSGAPTNEAAGALQCGGGAIANSGVLTRSFTGVLNTNPWYSKSFDHNTPLPIELLEFTANAVANQKALLKWSTATEKNNAYFSIQRSRDGINWIEIGQEKGAGNSLETQFYKHTDEKPFIGVNYYRLEQFDLDGASSFSPIRTVAFTGKGELAVTAYPNPTNQVLNLQIDGGKERTYELVVFNVLGQRLPISFTQLPTGTLQPLNTANWTPGVYWLQISTEQGGIVHTMQIVKVE